MEILSDLNCSLQTRTIISKSKLKLILLEQELKKAVLTNVG